MENKSPITGYSVKITAKRTCVPSKKHLGMQYPPSELIQAESYFHTLIGNYQCFDRNDTEDEKRASGQNYFITLITLREQ